jgi:hypothetical protein
MPAALKGCQSSDFLLTLFITFNSYVMNVWPFNI